MSDELPSVNVAMLGASGVGKTSYMAALYCHLQDEVAGLAIHAANKKAHAELNRLGLAVSRGVYPPGTAFRTRYDFLLHHRGAPVLQFRWHDYFGQALDTPDTEAQTRALLRDLDTMDALLVFCDSSELEKPRSRMGSILAAMSLANAALTAASRPLSIVFVLTKADVVDEWTLKRLQPLEGLMTAIAEKSALSGSIVPVSCANGRHNVELPLLFVLHCAAKKHIAEHKQAEAAAEERGRYWAEQSTGFIGFLRELKDIVTNSPTDTEMAEYCRSQAERPRLLRLALEPSATALARAIVGIVRIKRGKKLLDYVALLGGSTRGARVVQRKSVWR